MGVEQENCVRVTRGESRKRVDSKKPLHPQPANKKPVILGELENLANTVVDLRSDGGGQKRKGGRSKKKEQKAVIIDIYAYLHSMEVEDKRRPKTDYIETIQRDVTAQMRGILVDWLVEVAEKYKLVSDFLYLTISYLDRYLSSNAINR